MTLALAQHTYLSSSCKDRSHNAKTISFFIGRWPGSLPAETSRSSAGSKCAVHWQSESLHYRQQEIFVVSSSETNRRNMVSHGELKVSPKQMPHLSFECASEAKLHSFRARWSQTHHASVGCAAPSGPPPFGHRTTTVVKNSYYDDASHKRAVRVGWFQLRYERRAAIAAQKR